MTFFKKAAVFTDIHLGLKSNAKTHNDDCVEFVDWFIATAKEQGCETAIFCGDWNHNRNSINITTMNAGLECLEKIGAAFEKTIFFPGNHDLYYKDRRDMNSVAFGKHVPGIQMITEPIVMDEVAFIPWLVGDEWKKINKIKLARYLTPSSHHPRSKMWERITKPTRRCTKTRTPRKSSPNKMLLLENRLSQHRKRPPTRKLVLSRPTSFEALKN